MSQLTDEQVDQVEKLVNKHIYVNANWAIAAMFFVYNLSGQDSCDDKINPTPFTYENTEDFMNFRAINEKTGKPYDDEDDNYNPVEFPQCMIVSDYLAGNLINSGELVINAGIAGNFWFVQEWGVPFANRPIIQKAFFPLLKTTIRNN